MWEVSTGTLLRSWDAHFKRVSALVFASEDDALLVSGGEDAIVHVWNFAEILSDLGTCSFGEVVPVVDFSHHTLAVTMLIAGTVRYGPVRCAVCPALPCPALPLKPSLRLAAASGHFEEYFFVLSFVPWTLRGLVGRGLCRSGRQARLLFLGPQRARLRHRLARVPLRIRVPHRHQLRGTCFRAAALRGR